MGLINFLKNSFFLQDIVSWGVTRIPTPIYHNIEKIKAIRRAFAYVNHEGIQGDYIEFGVFQGTSLITAINAFRHQHAGYDVNDKNDRCRFIGCDSFEGLKKDFDKDGDHPIFDNQELLKVPYEVVMKRLKKYRSQYEIIILKGFFCDTLPSYEFKAIGIEKLRVVFFDCDLITSTRDALKYSAPMWQEGTVLIFDDMFAYKGNPDKGEAGAFKELCDSHPEFRYRDFGSYGIDGKLFVVTNPPNK